MAVSLGGDVEGEGGSGRGAGKTEKKGNIKEFYHAEIVISPVMSLAKDRPLPCETHHSALGQG